MSTCQNNLSLSMKLTECGGQRGYDTILYYIVLAAYRAKQVHQFMLPEEGMGGVSLISKVTVGTVLLSLRVRHAYQIHIAPSQSCHVYFTMQITLYVFMLHWKDGLWLK